MVVALLACGSGDDPPARRDPPSQTPTIVVFEAGTVARRRVLALERPGTVSALQARAEIPPGPVHRVEIEATIPPGEALPPPAHPLVVGLAGERLLARQVDEAGSIRRYHVDVDVDHGGGELTVWAPRPLLAAKILIDTVTLVRWEPAEAGLPPGARRVRAGAEERAVEVLARGHHLGPLLEVSDPAQRLRLAWTALGPPDATTTLTVTLRGRHGEQRWFGVRQPREGFGEVEIDLGPLGRGRVESTIEIDGAVGAGLARHQLVGPGSGSRPRTLVILLEHLPEGALAPAGPMPSLRRRSNTMAVLPLSPFPLEISALFAALMTGRDPLQWEHELPTLTVPTAIEASGGHAWAWTEGALAPRPSGGFGRWSIYSGGWPQEAAPRLLRDLALNLVDDPAPGMLAVAALSAGPPWPLGQDEAVVVAASRSPPGFLLEEQLGRSHGDRPLDAFEAAAAHAAVAGRLDRALGEVWDALERAPDPWSLLLVAADVGGGPGFVAVDGALESPAAGFSALQDWGRVLAASVGLPRRGEGGEGSAGGDFVPVAWGTSEELDRSGRILGWDGHGRGAWIHVLPWGAVAPRLGGSPGVAHWLQRHAATSLVGARLDVARSDRRMSLILRASSLGVGGLLAVDGEVAGRLSNGGTRADLEVAAGRSARLILLPTVASPRLEIEGLEVECGTVPWVIERGPDELLRRHPGPAGGAVVVSYRPTR